MTAGHVKPPNGTAPFERPSCTVAQVYPELLRALCALLVNYRGVPLTICTCNEGHRWMKEDFGISFYHSHAETIAEMNAGFSLVAKLGGEATVDWLYQYELPFDRDSVLDAMRAAALRHGLEPKPDDCEACRRSQMDCEILYLIGWPMEVSHEFFRVELAAN